MLDFNNAQSNYMGHVAIQFRNDDYIKNEKLPSNCAPWYALNSMNDGWFRVADKNELTYGYGLKLKYLEITSNKGVDWGYNKAFKASMIFEANDGSTVKESIWIYMEEDVDIKLLKDYIAKNARYWVD